MGTGPDTRAVGLTGQSGWNDYGYKTSCELYTDSNCSQGFQSVSVEGTNKWGCTAFNRMQVVLDAGIINRFVYAII